MKNVSVIGAGVLGSALVRRLLRCGFDVQVYNRTKQKLKELIDEGARSIDDLDTAFSCKHNLWLLCLRDENSIRDVFFKDKIIGSQKSHRSLVVNTSTIGPSACARLEQFFTALNVEYIELPVSGGAEGALSGELVGYLGKFPEYLNPDFGHVVGALLKSYCLMQSNQAAQAMKVINNYCEAINLSAAAEALLLAETYGIPKKVIAGSLGLGRGRSAYQELLLKRYLSTNPPITVPLEIRIKDLELCGELFKSMKVQSFYFDSALDLYRRTLHSSVSAQDQMDCYKYLCNRTEG